MIPEKITSWVAPCLEIPPHTWIFSGCLCLYFNFLGVLKALPSVALQLDCWLINEYHIVKCLLLFDAITAPVKSLSFVSFTNCLTISRSCEARAKVISDPVSHTIYDQCAIERLASWESVGLFLSATMISNLGNDGILATTIGDFAGQLLCG